MDTKAFKLQFITHFTEQYSYLDSARMALEGGCRWIQLRMKDASDEEVKAIAVKVQELCRQHNATFIIDDRVELVKKLKADGVHLGKNDMPIAEARSIGCGPFRFTTTKKKLSPILGLEGYRSITSQMKAEGINLPIVAIGGITIDDIPEIMQIGVTGIALSGTILRAENPVEETRKIVEMVERSSC